MRAVLVLMTVVLVNLSLMGCGMSPGVDSTAGKIGPNTSILQSKSTLLTQIECENMTLTGPYAGKITSPFNGAALYGSSDYCYTTYNFSSGQYQIVIDGCSSTSSPAGATLYIGGTSNPVGAVSLSSQEMQACITFSITSPGNTEIRIGDPTDNGTWDLYLNYIQIYYVGAAPTPPAPPTPPTSTVWSTGAYKNLFLAAGSYIGVTSSAQVDQKVGTAVSNFFGYGDTNYQIYYPVGSDKAYIFTADTSDVRSEGMSYGTMIAVQMNMQSEFNKLWNWAKTYMQHPAGDDRAGYFSWDMHTDGTVIDNNPAPDGEQYFAMALFFASKRWGNGSGIYNYNAEATNILQHVLYENLYTSQYSSVTPMFSNNIVVFVPYGNSATFSDPSYHLPAFYELFAKWDTAHSSTWSAIAAASRAFWKTACNSSTGLFPDYANFDGSPNGTGNHNNFLFDAWRVIQNLSIDYYWFNCANGDTWESAEADKIQTFFASQGVTSYGNQYSLTGSQLPGASHSPGLVAMNAVGSLIASKQQAWDFVKDLWNITPTAGQYRYYDGCLYLLGLLHVSGKYQIWGAGVVPPSPSSSSSSSSSCFSSSSSSSSTGFNIPCKIEAENYNNMSGIQTEACSDTGGTLDVGWIDTGDWMTYPIIVPASGCYTITYRVASLTGGQLASDLNASAIQLGSVNVPATGGWQTWTTVSQTVNLTAGTYSFGIYANIGGWNINWLNFAAQSSLSSSSSSVSKASSSSSSSTPISSSSSSKGTSSSSVSSSSTFNRLQCQYGGNYLNCSANTEGASVVCSALNTSWTSEQWVMESGGRIRNVWTGLYLTCSANTEGASVLCQSLNTSWTSQQWTQQGNRFQNNWTGRYLTASGNGNGAQVLCQTLNTSWTSQQWNIQ